MEDWLQAAARAAASAAQEAPTARNLTILSEFALAAVLLEGDEESGGWSTRILDGIAPACLSPPLAHLLLMDRDTVAAQSWICEGLLRRGRAPPLGLAPLRTGLAQRAAAPPPFYPLARMEALYLSHRLGRIVGEPWSSPARLGFRWPDGCRPQGGAEVYQLTHACFFLSNFGAFDWPLGRSVLEAQLGALAGALEAGVALCRAASQLDLIAEIALARHCLGVGRAAPLLQMLADAQRPDGSILGWPAADEATALRHGTLTGYLAARLVPLVARAAAPAPCARSTTRHRQTPLVRNRSRALFPSLSPEYDPGA